MKKFAVLWCVLFGIFIAFSWWWGGTGQPMSTGEVERRLTELERLTLAKGGTVDQKLFASLRQLAASDDGNEFYMLNLMRFRDKAAYPAGSDYSDEPRAAHRRYGKAIAPHLIRNGNLPILVGRPSGTFLQPSGMDEWDEVAVVRYRSRRDLYNMARDIAADPADVAIHKWASMKKTQVFPVEPGFDLMFVRGLIAALLLIIGSMIHCVLRWGGHRNGGA